MEFHEKLQELRKRRGLTQEELAEMLYVSRTAISKWESGRGYPSIDSLKAIANCFSVTIDELLSGEKLITIAEEEKKENVRSMCGLLLGIIDLGTFLLIVLPLYPCTVEGFVYSVNLVDYAEVTEWIRLAYWGMFGMLVVMGVLQILLIKRKVEKSRAVIADISIGLGILLVLFLAITGETYAVTVAFLLVVAKGAVLLKSKEISKE
ncbi:MAG: helix-turn-helix transcriptional regulator [Lachnospiraceae bacterium]|nr:helix-turn-helix transcriptional regulator [Lachnospiraceae bacterium]